MDPVTISKDTVVDVVDVKTSSATAEAPATTTPAAQTPAAEKDPNWLPARLERERKAILRDLGVEDVDNAKAAFAELKKRQDAEKTENEKLRAENDQLKVRAQRAVELEGALKVRSDAELAALSDTHRETVMALAGEDPAKIVTAIEKLRSAGMFGAAVVTAPAPVAVAQPANTASSAPAPTPGTHVPSNHLATYERLQAANPILAAPYFLEHYAAIQAEQENRSK